MSGPRGPRLRMAVSLLALPLVVAGCGVPAEDRPRTIEPGTVRPSAPAAPPETRSGGATETLCLVRQDRLVPVPRRVAGPRPVPETVAELLAGPTQAESAGGLMTALGGAPLVTDVRLEDDVAVVTLRSAAGDSSRSDDVLALGQVVCTLTARPDVEGVAFERGGVRVAVPRGDGSLSPGPLGPADFAQLYAATP